MSASPGKAVVLLSGGLDSATALAWARSQGYECHTLAVDYGQRHRVELRAARETSAALGAAAHREIGVDLRGFGGSALTSGIEVPKHRATETMAAEIPSTYVPARNTIFLALALAYAETLGATAIVAGMNALDYSGYPDCRPEFLEAFERVAAIGTRAGVEGAAVRILAPLLRLDKAGIVRLGTTLGVDYGLTHSCYDPGPDGAACGACDSCLLRAKGFREAGLPDPTRYRPAATGRG